MRLMATKEPSALKEWKMTGLKWEDPLCFAWKPCSWSGSSRHFTTSTTFLFLSMIEICSGSLSIFRKALGSVTFRQDTVPRVNREYLSRWSWP
jgi:hypothetical protein